MDASRDTTVQGRVNRVRDEYAKRQQRLFTTFALIQGPVLVAAAIAVYVLELVDRDLGTWIIMGIVLLGGIVLSVALMRQIRQRTAAEEQARGTAGTIW